MTDAEGFDAWYSDMERSPRKDEIQQRHLGLPAHVQSSSLLTWDGIAEVIERLRLLPGETLVDLACGRGGYGLEVAQRTGATLLGVDFSAVAIRQAREHATRLGWTAEFRVGALEDTGLPDASADAVLVVDAIQFASPPEAAFTELRRVLRPGGRVALTCWEALDADDDRLPERLRRVDLRRGLTVAGFGDVVVEDRPSWLENELAMWREAAALDPGDDPALAAFHEEGQAVLGFGALERRVIASATA